MMMTWTRNDSVLGFHISDIRGRSLMKIIDACGQALPVCTIEIFSICICPSAWGISRGVLQKVNTAWLCAPILSFLITVAYIGKVQCLQLSMAQP